MKRKRIYLMPLLTLIGVGELRSDDFSDFPFGDTSSGHYESLVEVMNESEQRARIDFAEVLEATSSSSSSSTRGDSGDSSKGSEEELRELAGTPPLGVPEERYPSFYRERVKSSDEQIQDLLQEVSSLKAKVVHVQSEAGAVESSVSQKRVGSKTYFNYSEGKIYEIHAGVDRVTDIELGPLETLTNTPLSGDTVRWKIGVVSSGEGADARTHLILKPLEENIETNILIPTSKRVYHLRVRAGDWYMPSVAWRYPDEDSERVAEFVRRQETVEPVGITPEALQFQYRVEGKKYPWRPVRVFDDGVKTYFQMPPEMSVAEAPVLFVIDEHGEPMLVNYRVKGAYYILDRLFERAQMRVGKEGIVSIYSKGYEPSLFERLF